MRILELFLTATLLFGIAGCAGVATAVEPDEEEYQQVPIEMTPRQIAILEEQGLSNDYNELDMSQKSAIESIESMLCYLEEKYSEDFCYLSYTPAFEGEKEFLSAYPADGAQEDVIAVYRYNSDGNIVYEDNYAVLKAQALYEENVTEFVSEFVDARFFGVFSEILNTDLDDVNEANIRSKAEASTYVFIDEKNCTMENYERLVQAGEEWLKDNYHGSSENIRFLLTKQEEVYLITRAEVLDKVAEDIFAADTLCMISRAGEVRRY